MKGKFPLLPLMLLVLAWAGCSVDDTGQSSREGFSPSSARVVESTDRPSPGNTTVVSGTLIDTHCYGEDRRHVGLGHDRAQGFVPGCAALCARYGYPVGVLPAAMSGRTVWVLVTSPAVLADYMAEQVRVTGQIRSEGVLIPHRIELRTGDKWTYIL